MIISNLNVLIFIQNFQFLTSPNYDLTTFFSCFQIIIKLHLFNILNHLLSKNVFIIRIYHLRKSSFKSVTFNCIISAVINHQKVHKKSS